MSNDANTLDDIKIAETRGYFKGYRAGRKRSQADAGIEARQRHENTVWHRYMVAALGPAVTASGWTTGKGQAINSLFERVGLAADFADKAVAEAKARGRL